MVKKEKKPLCDREDCFAAKRSHKIPGMWYCSCLSDNDFAGGCPFFKTEDEQEQSLMTYEQRKIQLAKEAKERKKRENVRTISGVQLRRKANGGYPLTLR